MMRKKVSSENYELDPQIYSKTSSTIKIIFLTTVFLILGFFANFSAKEKLTAFLGNSLKNNTQCPVNFSSLKIKNLIFKYNLKDPEILGRCFGNPYITLPLSNLSLALTRPTLVPPGLKISSQVKHLDTNLNINGILGIGDNIVNIDNSTIDLNTLSPLIPELEILGTIKLNSHIVLDDKGPKSGNISLNSDNITIPSQTIKGFNLNNIPIGNILLNAVMEKKNVLNIKQLIIGNANSPIISEISGTITLSPSYMPRSMLNLKGKLKVSPDFQRTMPILNLFLGGKKTDDKGFFTLTISGTLGGPRPSFQ